MAENEQRRYPTSNSGLPTCSLSHEHTHTNKQQQPNNLTITSVRRETTPPPQRCGGHQMYYQPYPERITRNSAPAKIGTHALLWKNGTLLDSGSKHSDGCCRTGGSRAHPLPAGPGASRVPAEEEEGQRSAKERQPRGLRSFQVLGCRGCYKPRRTHCSKRNSAQSAG